MMQRFKQVFCLLFLLLAIGSLAQAQQETRAPKTFQLFAKEDDPSGRLAIDEEPSESLTREMSKKRKVFRQREAIINPALLNLKWETMEREDKLVGQLFEDKYIEATVVDVFPMDDKIAITSVLNSSSARMDLGISK